MTPTRTEFLHLTVFEVRLFYFLVFLSLAIAAAQVVARARLWRKGRPAPPPTNSWAQVWRFIVGQRKVQSSRPRSGAPMHLLLFWGFLALFVATTLLAIATYFPVHFHKGTYFLIYEATFDTLGLAFIAGCVWALLRRIRVARDPKSPISHRASDYWALVLLLALGIGGYVVEAGRIATAPTAWDSYSWVGYGIAQLMGPISGEVYRVLWWSHALTVMAFFAIVPQMRMKHLVVATLTAARMHETPMGRLRPVSIEEVELEGKVGAGRAEDLSRWHLMSLDACMECGRCTEVCPATRVGKPLNPKLVVQDSLSALLHDAELPASISEEALWACTTCNACVEACPVLIRHVDVISDARRFLVAEGRLAGSGATMLRQTASSGHAWGAQASTREDWMKGSIVPLARNMPDFDVLFWVGCAGSNDPLAQRTSRAMVRLLSKAQVNFACLGKEELCTGDAARRLGDEFTFQDLAARNIATLERYGVREIVTACPHCMNTLRNEYPDFGGRYQVFHHTEYLDRLVSEGKLRAASLLPGSAVYHDPCYLARINRVSDAPRRLLGAESHFDDDDLPAISHAVVAEPAREGPLLEPREHARKTLCCGAGGARLWMEESPEQRPGAVRAEQLLETGASEVLVSCPFCRIMLGDSLKQVRPESAPVPKDVAEAVLEANE